MGTDVCRKHFENISKHLAEFEQKPKEVNGNLIPEWFNVGEDVFQEFYNLGTSLKWNYTPLRQSQEVEDILCRVTKNQDWLQSFLSMYPGVRIDMEGATPAVNICQVRSGLETLLQGFAGIHKPFDNVLIDLKQMGELEEFDEHLKVWADSHRPDFFPGDRHPDTPKSHWWWL
ncbi:uncharacterized protein [Epargyreus clarus]|uniref:uncharacterized protein n=1 Tax=Epargyreus clarus TaxID=520877 RepID=UPI003C30AF3F